MTDTSYLLRTKKTWHETMQELEEQMRLWGIKDWETNYPKGARTEAWIQKEEDRTVKLTYHKNGKTVTLVMGKQNRAVDNLRVLYLAIEAMRLNERRGISDVLESAYLQLAAPTATLDPYELLEIRPDTSLEVAEAAYKAKVRKLHPDKGGSVEQMKHLNQAIEEIRRKLT
jgi:hypothetical protein